MKRRIFGVVLILSMLLSMIITPGNVFAERTDGNNPEEAADGILLNQVNIIHFYDWDGTYLGDNLFWAIGGKEAAYRAVEEFSRKNYAGGYTVDNSTHEDRYADDASKPLTYKKGYNFGGWAEVTPETLDSTFTAYATEEEINAAIKDCRNDSLNFDGNGAYVKAAYVGNETLDTGTKGLDSEYYTYCDFTYKKVTGQIYEVEFTLKRENTAGQGVTRLKEPIVRITLMSGEKKFIIKNEVKNKDKQRVSLEIPGECDKFAIVVQDNGTGRHYSVTNAVSIEGTLNPKVSSSYKYINGRGYKSEGTFTDLNNKLMIAFSSIEQGIRPNTWTLPINYAAFDDMNLSEIVLVQHTNIENSTNAILAGIARNKIMLYSAANGKRTLTWEEVEQAIQMDTGTHLTNPSAIEYISYMQPKVEAVYQESQANYGGVMTAQELEAYINANF